jgi:hypothetical protein
VAAAVPAVIEQLQDYRLAQAHHLLSQSVPAVPLFKAAAQVGEILFFLQ